MLCSRTTIIASPSAARRHTWVPTARDMHCGRRLKGVVSPQDVTGNRHGSVSSPPARPEVVREHFNCSTLEGAELEDQGGDGTAITHWEKRVFENEAMTGTHTQNSVFSRITFALMEDTGWYRADYSHAQDLDWGRGLGCGFAAQSCKEWLNTSRFRSNAPRPFLLLPCIAVSRRRDAFLTNFTTVDDTCVYIVVRANSSECACVLDSSVTTRRRHLAAPFCERIKGDPLRTECSPRRNAVVICNLVKHDVILPRQYQVGHLLKP
ncbi:Leishmanolysin-like peptidase [Eumeta japonica]|uniref:Leishmanolysin-like peptidase n=1 Tax=Eumeta variegata TaxID=151549 RepID=A0A4C1UAQ6_EUMVA|nr:Leishmanolysin-like peptidase [Eumeta japonica]